MISLLTFEGKKKLDLKFEKVPNFKICYLIFQKQKLLLKLHLFFNLFSDLLYF